MLPYSDESEGPLQVQYTSWCCYDIRHYDSKVHRSKRTKVGHNAIQTKMNYCSVFYKNDLLKLLIYLTKISFSFY